MIDKIITMIKRRETKIEDIFDMVQIREYFSEKEINNLRKQIETTEGRCIGCGTLAMLNNKHYCKICYKNDINFI